MESKKVLMLLGGTWHDFDGFAATIRPVLEQAGYAVEATYDLDTLTRLGELGCDVVLLYTCLTEQLEDGRPATLKHSAAQIAALAEWVKAGGGLLAVHAATVAGQSSPTLRALMGGVFVTHPPAFAFTVYPLHREHPITAGVPAFTVYDELYVQDYDADVAIHAVTIDRGVAYPMVWTRTEGRGRVAHIAMGHGEEVWILKPYQQLLQQAVKWLTTHFEPLKG
ncbi:MAG: ThuA domain-containing protein [Anaerolineae bacterium]|nr:ThuA domain-containing protein [Anaerolineae bacterium]